MSGGRPVDGIRRLALAAARAPVGVAPAQGGEADGRTRTGDPFITSEVLYQLSYVGGAREV